jgi:thymidylate kinase
MKDKLVTLDGLDCTGKSTIIRLLSQDLQARVITSPPDAIKPLRPYFDQLGPEMRFWYYVFGNVWINWIVMNQPVENASKITVSDRSWLSTLAAHDLRGVKKNWLDKAASIAKRTRKPDLAVITHVDPTIRRQRLSNRGADKTDITNLAYEDTMEERYTFWANVIGWNIMLFDNTNLSPTEAKEKLKNIVLNV